MFGEEKEAGKDRKEVRNRYDDGDLDLHSTLIRVTSRSGTSFRSFKT